MTQALRNGLTTFDYGLASLLRAPEAQPTPAARPTGAVHAGPVVQLDALFAAQTSDDMLAFCAVPVLGDASILDPATYGAALGRARDLLLDRAGLSGPAERAVFADALQIIEGMQLDRDLLQENQLALLRA